MRKIQLQKQQDKKTFEEGYKEFILNCQVKGLSPYTIKFYNNVVRIWSSLYDPEKQYINTIDQSTVNTFIMFLQNEMDENDITINTNLRGIKAVLYYFIQLGYMQEFKIPKLKATKEIIETYTDKEIGILLKKPDIKNCTFLEYRNWVICNFLLGTGCRARTLVNIKVEDIDIENQLINFKQTKNRKQYTIPMSNNLRQVLMEYMQYRKPETEKDYIFVNAFGDKLEVPILSTNLRQYNISRGVMKTGVHRWRHTFAKMWILQGGDIFRLQKILGHSSLDIVKEYVDMFTNDLQKDFNEFNPLEQVKGANKNHMNMSKYPLKAVK